MQAKIKITIFRFLARREYSSARIEQKLLAKGFALGDVQAVIQALSADGTISDLRFTDSYIRYRQSQGYGPLRIRQELQVHGIHKEMIEDRLNITDNAWFTEVSRVWQKKFKGKKPSDLKDRQKQIRFLQYRGFTQEQIETVLKDNSFI
jgi:regulatory protein